MSLRKILIAAAIAAPLAFSPVQASAQQGRGAEARAQAHAIGGQIVTQLPPGIAKKVERGGSLPPGIARRYSPPAPPAPPVPDVQPEPEPEPEPQPEPCGQEFFIGPDGLPYVRDCHGNVTPAF